MPDAPKTIYYFSSTHWDREWYQTFQGFRMRLVALVDDLLDLLENDPEFEVFHFDGQTIVLEDYLAIRPENRGRLEKLISAGRILIGPWYVMPDEFLVSGEALIRNLQIGHRICDEWGVPPWKFGYICDLFGHMAQTPQIFQGFGIKNAILGRGNNNHTTDSFFRWQALDGSEVTTFKLNDYLGYGDVLSIFIKSGNVAVPELTPEFRRRLEEELPGYVAKELGRSKVPIVLIMDGVDHEPAHAWTGEMLALLRKTFPDTDVRHCSLDRMGEELEGYLGDMQVKSGELIETTRDEARYAHLISNTLSSHYPLKQFNDRCQNLLERWLEPLHAFAWHDGVKIPRSYLDLAWQYLITNHPHDSICGCSVDRVHENMVYRFNQCEEIADNVLQKLLQSDPAMNFPEDDDVDALTVRLYNPLPYPARRVIRFTIDFPKTWAAQWREPFPKEKINAFIIEDAAGNEVPYTLTQMTRGWVRRLYNQHAINSDPHEVVATVDLQPMGWTELSVKAVEHPVRYRKGQLDGQRAAENAHTRIDVNRDGTVTLTDKRSGKQYANLLDFVSTPEIGDGWFHIHPVNGPKYTCVAAAHRIDVEDDGPGFTAFRIERILELPAGIERTDKGMFPSEETVRVPITMRITLADDVPGVRVNITVDNTACDHKLTVLLPTGIDNDEYFASQAFGMVTRKGGMNHDTDHWKEAEPVEKNFADIIGKRDGAGDGIAFVSAGGLKEGADYGDGEGTLAVTLFRSFQSTIMTNGEPGGQVQREMTFDFALCLLDAGTTFADLQRGQQHLAQAPWCLTVPVSWEPTHAYQHASLLELEGDALLVSSVKQSHNDDGTIMVRIWNASGTEASGTLVFDAEVGSAFAADFLEVAGDAMDVAGNRIAVTLSPWKIQTVAVTLRVRT